MSWGGEKRDKMQSYVEHFINFCNEFDNLNNTGAQMLDFIYHMTLKLFSNQDFGVKTL